MSKRGGPDSRVGADCKHRLLGTGNNRPVGLSVARFNHCSMIGDREAHKSPESCCTNISITLERLLSSVRPQDEDVHWPHHISCVVPIITTPRPRHVQRFSATACP